MTDVFVPTYKKQSPSILNLLNDINIRLNLCVRPEEDDAGFYEHLKATPRLRIIRLREGLNDLGDTRQAIVEYCIEHGYMTCAMLDDTILDIVSRVHPYMRPSEIIDDMTREMWNDPLSQYIAGFGCIKGIVHRPDGSTFEYKEYKKNHNERYFVTHPGQFIVLNIQVLQQYDVNYLPIENYGLEDIGFCVSAIKKGLIFLFNDDYRFHGEEANVPKNGGQHATFNSYQKIRLRYADKAKQLFDLCSDTMGILLEGSYKKHLKGMSAVCTLDWQYLRKVLVEDRRYNEELIEHGLSKEYFYNVIMERQRHEIENS